MLGVASIEVMGLAPNSEGWVSNYGRLKDSHTCCRNIKGTVFLTKDMTKGSKANSVYLSEFVKEEIEKYLESNSERLVTLKSPPIYSQRTDGHFSSRRPTQMSVSMLLVTLIAGILLLIYLREVSRYE